ncbi:MFS transporter [Streptomyces sp. WMMB 322]|uniref:MFS transporter n=1 Tax=Streptomyces sp. WMMB 322 TaxID=1286821 RepID=UPI0006E18183|nr:MFS transporter [Streptomyces sp. WMMB 322]SCK15480.1 Predicted arabinose efflux permease, MFS family [Streptomyces sp. WMMB 322]
MTGLHTSGSTSGAATGTGDRPQPRFALPALCVTQITGWGVLYYAFPVLLPHLTAETGWSGTAATGAFSAALLVSALVGIPVGRVLDRRGPRAVMTAGSVLGAASVLAVAAAPDFLVFAGAWLCAGAAMAGTLYPPAFAAVTRWWGPDRVRGLTILTLAGGLASTVFAPVTAALVEHMSWRAAYATLAVILAAVTVPAHALALRAPWPPAPDAPNSAGQPGTAAKPRRPVARTRPFVLLAVALTLSACSSFAVVIGIVPLLNERGATSTQAAWALGLGGLGQTLGRICYSPFARRTGVTTRTGVLIAAGGVTTATLAVVPGPVPLLIALAVGVGMVRGNLTLLHATAVTDRWGTRHYGKLSGILAAPVTVATGLAPFAGAALAGPLGGYPALFLTLAAVSVLSAVLALGGTPRAPEAGQPCVR